MTLNSCRKSRLPRIDMMVGIAMILVVMGHMTFNFTPGWYNHGLHTWIYAFHMELFVFLSAFLIRYSYREVHSVKEYLRYEGRKFSKFFLPFILVGSLVGIASAYFNGILDQGCWVNILAHEVETLLVWPMQCHASFLWYIYVLMGFYLISPLFFRLPRWGKMTLCLLSMALPLLPVNYQFGGALFAKYLFFYCLGVLCAEGIDELRSIKGYQWLLASLPFVAWTIYFIITKDDSLYSVLTGFIALPAVYGLARIIERIPFIRWSMTKISQGCYWIYLFQMFIIWGCAIAYRESILIEAVPFWGFMVTATLLSLSLPLCFQSLSKKLERRTNGEKIQSKV